MLPKPIRQFYYWVAYRGKVGYYIAQIVNYSFMHLVRLLRIKASQDRVCLTIISHKYRFIYIGIPKTATRSMMHEFTNSEYESEWFETAADYQRVLQEYPDYFKFTFVRNPYARILSCYNSKIKDAVLGKQARIMSFYQKLSPKMSFSDFVHWLGTEEGGDKYADRHWLSQSILLSDDDEDLLCDYVGKYETLADDLNVIRDKLGLAHDITLEQKGHISNTDDYRTYYDADMRAEIAARYRKDFELFGYDVEEA